jgi:hypothetical protein
MVEAHEALSATYRAMGQRDKSIAELKEILQIKERTQSAKGPSQTGIKELLFSVPTPGPSGIAAEPQPAGTAQSEGSLSDINERH